MMKYEKSFFWSPRYTPSKFVFGFLMPAFFVAGLMLYIHYIAQPKTMLRIKRQYGIKIKELQARGWLDNWLDEYIKPDEVLRF